MSVLTSFEYPAALDNDDKLAYGVGALVMHWGTCESLFYGLLDAMAGKPDNNTGPILWLSHRNTRDRLDLVVRLAREQGAFPTEVAAACKKFRSINRVRNHFCHAAYRSNAVGDLLGVESHTLTDKDEPLQADFRPLSSGMLNEIAHAIHEAEALNPILWELLIRVRDKLGVSHPALPPELPEYLSKIQATARRT